MFVLALERYTEEQSFGHYLYYIKFYNVMRNTLNRADFRRRNRRWWLTS